jgi:hypothetical protein
MNGNFHIIDDTTNHITAFVKNNTAIIESHNEIDIIRLIAVNGWNKVERRSEIHGGMVGWDIVSVEGQSLGFTITSKLEHRKHVMVCNWNDLDIKPHEIIVS